MPWTLQTALREVAARLASAGAPDPMRDARILARWAMGLDAAGLAAADPEAPLTDLAWRRLEAAAAARAARRPISHIIGARSFFGRTFKIDARALDPRPESETLVACALDGLALSPSAAPRILDLGVGSGCLLLSVLAEAPQARGLGVDASDDALALAAENAQRFGLADRVTLARSDWLSAVSGVFDLVLCNPPYIGAGEIAALEPEVRLYEPMMALSPGEDALAAYRHLSAGLAGVLAPHGRACFEVGEGQAQAVAQIFGRCGFRTRILRDLGGVERVIELWRQADRKG